MRKAFAKYIGVDEKDVKEDDIPIVAIAASGGGAFPTSLMNFKLIELQVIAR
jgi:hypothetical protein